MARRLLRPVRLSLIAACSAASYYALTADTKTSPVGVIFVTTHGLVRSSRAVYTFAVNSLDYKYSLHGYDNKSEEYYKARSEVHCRAAGRILKLCEANKGFYIKAGQFVASLQHMPKEYVSTLSALQDQASPCTFEVVERVLKEEFGEDIMDIYQVFDKQPVAAASIAQVHHACLNDGKEVAVKVQYPALQQQFKIDIATMDILSQAVAWLFPDYQFQWIVPEFEKTSLKELDFVQEAQNGVRTARLFKRNRNVKIPCIYWEWSSHRVLTMEFVHGCKIDDIESLKKAGIDPRKVVRVLVEVFAQMIFLHGCVHGDPHPGNILISWRRDKQFQLVLLDHGLYRDLDEGFRLDFCCLWKSVVLGDVAEAQKVGERLGAGKYFKFLPIIFMGRTLESVLIQYIRAGRRSFPGREAAVA